jgi:hypothetical protein
MGILAKKPMLKLVRAAIAAVPVTKSLLISCVHRLYMLEAGLLRFKQ